MILSAKKKSKPSLNSTKKKQKVSETESYIREDSEEDRDYNLDDSLSMDIIEEEPTQNKTKTKKKERVVKKKSKLLEDLDNCEMERVNSENEDEILLNLPCRDKELKNIYDYIKKGLDTKGSYSSLYISGMPGTGKTACVSSTIQKLKNESIKNKVPPFDTYYINAMKMTKNNNFYKVLYEYIFNESTTKNFQRCCTLLDNFLKNRRDFNYSPNLRNYQNDHIVLVIDEIDCLIDKKQNILYNIFNWTTYPESKLIIISISNTLDLPERLMPKIISRIGTNRLSFKPYIRDELLRIMGIKLDNYDLFSEDALKCCCMKVASVTGDLRRILQICKRAEEIYYSEKDRPLQITISHVNKACNDLFDSKVVYVFKNLKIYEKIVIIAILLELKKNVNTKCGVSEIHKHQINLNSTIAKAPLNFEELRYIVYNLVKLKLLQLTEINNENFITNYVIIKFYPEEFTDTMKSDDDDLIKKLIDINLSSGY